MTKPIVLMYLMLSSAAFAEKTKHESKPAIFIVEGKRVSNSQALEAALQKTEVLRCQAVVLSPSKSGTSFSLRGVK